MRAAIARALPVGLKKSIAKTEFFENYTAKNYAKGLKRIDICSAQLGMMLQASCVFRRKVITDSGIN